LYTKLVTNPMLAGMPPVRQLPFTVRDASDVIDDQLSGTAPNIKFVAKFMSCSPVNF